MQAVNQSVKVLMSLLIPVKMALRNIIGVPAQVAGDRYRITCVSMGNPHCVVFNDEFDEVLDNLDLNTLGPKFENDPLFPERVNTEFVKVLNPTTLKMRVWERILIVTLFTMRMNSVLIPSGKYSQVSKSGPIAFTLIASTLSLNTTQ